MDMNKKGRYSGRHMTIYGYVLPGAVSLANWAARTSKLSEKAKHKLRVLDWLKYHNGNISLAARHFGLERETIRVWKNRLDKEGLLGLNDRSHRPKNFRKPDTSWEIVYEVVKIRRQYPAWSKYKINSLLDRKGIETSDSNVGRILKRRGLINKKISRKKSKSAKSPKARFPRGFKISCHGDMIQMDTKYIMLVGGKKYYQFTAIDVLGKKRVMRLYKTQSSRNGALFIHECINTFPFQIKNIQTDNGAPFQKEFDRLCQEINIPHYYTYPRNPKQNSYVEISHGADEREFYQQGNIYQDFETMKNKLAEWEYTWNNIRPHQALNYMTPNEYLNKWQTSRLPTKDIITLQT
jgi:transposase InsO family protein